MKDKIGIVLGILIAAAVIVTISLFVLKEGSLELNQIISIGMALIISASAIYILWDKIKNVKKGLPAKDERLKLTNYKAGHYAFIAAILSAAFIPLAIDILFHYELPGHLVTAVVVLCGGLAFIISYFYLAWTGN